MLACSQDIFFHNNENKFHAQQECLHKDKRIRHHQHHQQRDMTSDDLLENNINSNNSTAANSLKDKEEQVWPADVETAFIEALESIPKLGRRKILVNGKPCGRNELISDFIFRKTCKIRTRKQVSSHIQVLKNTRKGDSHFMRLLTDSVDLDEDNKVNTLVTNNNSRNANLKKMRQQIHHHHHPYHLHTNKMEGAIKMKTYQSVDSLSSDDSSINSSPSPTDYVFDIMYGDPAQQQALSMLQFKDFYDPFQQSLFAGMVNTGIGAATTDPFFGIGGLSTANLNSENLIIPLLNSEPMETIASATHTDTSPITDDIDQDLLINDLTSALSSSALIKKLTSKASIVTQSNQNDMNDMNETAALWPNYFCLYLEYSLPYDPCRPLSHNLAQLPHCYSYCLDSVSADVVSKEKCPPVTSLAENENLVLLLAKTKLDLNLNISDFVFNNTSFFETPTRRTIECTTTIYSFGNVVLESKEIQQALWVNEGKYMYSFVFVNQFFDAFMKGIRSLGSWDEVDIAINNLCIVQSFEDVENKYNNAPATPIASESPLTPSVFKQNDPLLVMVHEFERGNGTIEISKIMNESMIQQDHLDFFDQDL